MTSNILADTSIWIEFFKHGSKIGDKLAELIMKNSICTCGVVLFELVQGVKTENEKDLVSDTLSNLEYFEMSVSLWEKAGEISAKLKKNGLNLPLSDIFIAAICLEHNLSIFTLDKHFEQIPKVKVLSRQNRNVWFSAK